MIMSASLAGVSGWSLTRWPSQLTRRLDIVVLHSSGGSWCRVLFGDSLWPVNAYDFPEMSSLESFDCIFQFFGDGPLFLVIKEYTCNIRI